jgi:hypothetical protein
VADHTPHLLEQRGAIGAGLPLQRQLELFDASTSAQSGVL